MTQYFGYHKLTDVSIPQKTNSMKLRVHTFLERERERKNEIRESSSRLNDFNIHVRSV